MKLFISLAPPHRWITVDSKGQANDQGTVENIENYRVPKSVETVVGVAPGETIVCHSANIPGKRKKYAESALPYALEERLTEDVEDLHFKLLDWNSTGQACAAVVSNQQLSNWIERFNLLGVNLDAVVADYFLLPQHPKGEITIARDESQGYFIRLSKHQGMKLDQDGFQYWWDSLNKSNRTFSISNMDLAKKLNSELDGVQSSEGASHTINHWKIGNHFVEWLTNTHFVGRSGAIQCARWCICPDS